MLSLANTPAQKKPPILDSSLHSHILFNNERYLQAAALGNSKRSLISP